MKDDLEMTNVMSSWRRSRR